MELENIKIIIDMEGITYSEEAGEFKTYMNIECGNFTFPQSKTSAYPAAIFRWLLREMRLLVGKKNTIKERHVYFYPASTGHYLFLELVDENILSLRFSKRVGIENEFISHTIYSDEGFLASTTKYCSFDQFFLETYKHAELFYQAFKDSPDYGGNMFVLCDELEYSKKIVNKIVKKGTKGEII